MNTATKGLLNCARVADRELKWRIATDHDVKMSPHYVRLGEIIAYDPMYEGCASDEYTIERFSLDNDSDVLALWKGLAKKHISIEYNCPWWFFVNNETDRVSNLYNKFTDCLYAAAQEVVK